MTVFIGENSLEEKFQKFFYAFAGFLLAIIFELLLMKFLGHGHIFLDSINDMLSAGKDSDSTHNISHMMQVYFSDYKQILKIVLILLCPIGVFRKTIRINNKVVTNTVNICIMLFAFGLLRGNESSYLLYGFCTMSLLASLSHYRCDRRVVVLSFLALIYIYTQVLGSDQGVRNMGPNSLYWVLPYSLGICSKLLKNKIDNVRRYYAGFLICVGLLYVGRSMAHIMNGCYYDFGSRFEKRYLIDSSLASTYTTKRNIELLNPMLHELMKYVKPNDYLLCFQSIPMVNFLTQSRPYLYNSWVWTYDPSNFRKQIDIAEKEHDTLPIIVRQKSELSCWYKYDENWNNELIPYKKKRTICFNQFICKHHYEVVWENEVFQILKVK